MGIGLAHLESTCSSRFQPEGPSRGLLRDCTNNRLWNRWIDLRHYSTHYTQIFIGNLFPVPTSPTKHLLDIRTHHWSVGAGSEMQHEADIQYSYQLIIELFCWLFSNGTYILQCKKQPNCSVVAPAVSGVWPSRLVLQQNLSGSKLILIVSHVDSISMWATVLS